MTEATPTTHEEAVQHTNEVAVEALHTETAEEHVDPGLLGKFGINGVGFVGQLVNFLVILAILKFWVFPQVLKMMDERTRRIEQGMKDAEEAAKRLASTEEERASMLADAKAEARKTLEAAHAQAEKDGAETIEKAKREVERVVLAGKTQLKAEQETMIREARKEMAEIAVAAAKKILMDGMDEKKAASLAEETLRKLTK